MRAILMRIVFEPFWTAEFRDGTPFLGFGFMLIPWVIAGGVSYWLDVRKNGDQKVPASSRLMSIAVFVGVPTAAYFLVGAPHRTEGLPVFGYGLMMFVGIVTGTALAIRNAKQIGLTTDTILDATMWLVVPGVIGGRLFYVIQYRDQVFGGKQGLDLLKAAINLPDGGLVFFGAIIAGFCGFLMYCRKKSLSLLMMGDVILPAVIFGLGFGRIGCFLYGCCYGETCSLPWAVQFPADSIPFNALQNLGYLADDATVTVPLHPAQLYSAFNAFFLGTVLMAYFRVRPFNGSVTALAWLVYPVTRFLLELLRADEATQFGTPFTISQLISIGLLVTGLIYVFVLLRIIRPKAAPGQVAATGA